MICYNMKITSFHKVSEVLNGQVYCQQLTVKGAVTGFSWSELGREKLNRAPLSIHELLQNCSNCHIRHICHNACWCIRFGVKQQCCLCQGLLNVGKALVALSVHWNGRSDLDESNAFNGCRSWAHFGINGDRILLFQEIF